jgi:hypothetical protein
MNGDIETRLRTIETILSRFERKLYDMEMRLEKAMTLLVMSRQSIPAQS